MRRRLSVLALLALVTLLTMGAKRPKPMYMPDPIAVPDGIGLEDAIKVVETALTKRTWTVEEIKRSPDGESAEITTTLFIRVHEVKLRFLIDMESIRIEYVDSKEMRYKERNGQKYIHPKYKTWVGNLEKDIHSYFSLLKVVKTDGS